MKRTRRRTALRRTPTITDDETLEPDDLSKLYTSERRDLKVMDVPCSLFYLRMSCQNESRGYRRVRNRANTFIACFTPARSCSRISETEINTDLPKFSVFRNRICTDLHWLGMERSNGSERRKQEFWNSLSIGTRRSLLPGSGPG